MKRFLKNAVMSMIVVTGMVEVAMAGEASSNAYADSGWGRREGTAGASANYEGDGGQGLAKTCTFSGPLNRARGWAVGVDRDGIDFSFSHAFATPFGPGYAGTFNLSIGRDGSISRSLGNSVAEGGAARSVEAGGITRSNWQGTSSQATATGNTVGGGEVKAATESYNRPPIKVYRSNPSQGRHIAVQPRGWGR